eukprot:9116014-Lingulodinium_polyedra.AAC.4
MRQSPHGWMVLGTHGARCTPSDAHGCLRPVRADHAVGNSTTRQGVRSCVRFRVATRNAAVCCCYCFRCLFFSLQSAAVIAFFSSPPL